MAHSEKLQNFLNADVAFVIDGQDCQSADGILDDVFDPATGQVLARVHRASPAQTEQAVASAKRAFDDGRWSGLPPAAREDALLRLADLMERDGEDLARLETLEQGKSIHASRAVSVGGTVRFIRYAAGLATKISGRSFDVSLPSAPGGQYTAYTLRQPVGVVAAIAPWNFPLCIAIWKVIPALAAGCTVVLKPSELTPLTAIWLARLALEAGIPAGVLNVVLGTGAEVGNTLVTHPDIRKITFTGSTATGKQIGRQAIERMTRFSLELGGKNPALVMASADIGQAVNGLIMGGFFNQGQVCASSSRLYVEAAAYDDFRDAFTAATRSLQVGPGLDEAMQVNALVSQGHRDKVASYIADAKACGADIVQGDAGPQGDGYYVAPTLVFDPAPQLKLVSEEVFGPLVAITKVADAQEALRLANDTPYGLAASVWTKDLGQALSMVKQIEAGTVWVNTHVLLDANMPFGGMKQSGMGREFGVDWVTSFTEEKSVCIAH